MSNDPTSARPIAAPPTLAHREGLGLGSAYQLVWPRRVKGAAHLGAEGDGAAAVLDHYQCPHQAGHGPRDLAHEREEHHREQAHPDELRRLQLPHRAAPACGGGAEHLRRDEDLALVLGVGRRLQREGQQRRHGALLDVLPMKLRGDISPTRSGVVSACVQQIWAMINRERTPPCYKPKASRQATRQATHARLNARLLSIICTLRDAKREGK
eukprot:scaffold23405_cov39-Phaeocystis_antarctica.AAC.1